MPGRQQIPRTNSYGADSFWLKNESVEVYVTERGAHVAPVRFRLKHRWVEPLFIPPWSIQPDRAARSAPEALRLLRGSQFALPSDRQTRSRWFPCELAHVPWTVSARSPSKLELETRLPTHGCTVRKSIKLRDRDRAIYMEHVVEGLKGRFPRHLQTILQFSDGGGRLSAGPLSLGKVEPSDGPSPSPDRYIYLNGGAEFKDLRKVPYSKGLADLTVYPARDGCDDQVLLLPDSKRRTGWVAATLGRYVWFSLRCLDSLPMVLLRFINGGRRYEPWNGKRLRAVAVCEGASYFGGSTGEARRNEFIADGMPTYLRFSTIRPSVYRSIQGVAVVPKNFGRVLDVRPDRERGEVQIVGEDGCVTARLDVSFLHA